MSEITADFVRKDFLKTFASDMERLGVSRSELAARMGVTASRVSQIFSGKRNLRLRTMYRMSRAMRMKMAVVAYVAKEPIDGESIRRAWVAAGCPRDFWELSKE